MVSLFNFVNRFTRRQWMTLAVFSLADFCQAICVSLQAPFYPSEAEKKGANATEYGLVFGVFELTVFIVAPYLGKNLNKWGAKKVFNLGILTTGSCSILFGLLDKINNGTMFIAMSFLVRAVEAVGNSAFLTASFSIIAKEFPDNVATMFASLETFFGLGLIVGPTVGGALYELGGYILPFTALGGCLVCAACLTFFVLPRNYDEDTKGHVSEKGMCEALKIPHIALAAFSIICASSSIGFLLTTLEPHLRQFHLSPIVMGSMFVINGGTYALSAPFFGYICDKKTSPTLVNLLGATFITLSFTLLGPAPFIPLPTIFSVCVVALVFHGLGIGAMLVSSFATAHKQAVRNGFPDNLDTYGLISGLWTSTFALGAFIGPTVAGIMLDHFGMKFATLFISVFGMVIILTTLSFYGYMRYFKNSRREGYERLSGEDLEQHEDRIYRHGVVEDNSSRATSIGYDSHNGSPLNGATSGGAELNGASSSTSRSSPQQTVVIHVSASQSHYISPSTNPLSPKSPFQRGSVGLFGGVMGYSNPVLHEDANQINDGGHDDPMPHQFPTVDEIPPARNAVSVSRSQQKRKRSSKSKNNSEK